MTADLTKLELLQARSEDGQTMAEYGVVLGVITLGVVIALGFLALAVSGKYGPVTATIRALI